MSSSQGDVSGPVFDLDIAMRIRDIQGQLSWCPDLEIVAYSRSSVETHMNPRLGPRRLNPHCIPIKRERSFALGIELVGLVLGLGCYVPVHNQLYRPLILGMDFHVSMLVLDLDILCLPNLLYLLIFKVILLTEEGREIGIDVYIVADRIPIDSS